MFPEGDCERVDVLWGTIAGTSVIDIFQVGKKPILTSKGFPWGKLVVESIRAERRPYCSAAIIFFEGGKMEYTEKVINIYGSAHSHTP
jgi:hypothetical protein